MQIQAYLLSLVAAALIIAVVQAIIPSKSTTGAATQLLTGLFMVITLFVPLKSVNISGFRDLLPEIQAYSKEYTEAGEDYYTDAVGQVITEQTRAYICDKATQLGVTAEVEVTLSADSLHIPWSVHIKAVASPYAKSALAQYIEDTIGIPKERQTWS